MKRGFGTLLLAAIVAASAGCSKELTAGGQTGEVTTTMSDGGPGSTSQRMPGGPAMMPGTPNLAKKRPVLAGVLIGVGIALVGVTGMIAYAIKANANPPVTATHDPLPSATTPADRRN